VAVLVLLVVTAVTEFVSIAVAGHGLRLASQ